MQDRDAFLVTEILSQFDVPYKSSDGMMLSEAQEAARLESIEDQRNEDDGVSVDSDAHEDEPAEPVECNFHEL